MGCDIHAYVEVREPSTGDTAPWKMSTYASDFYRDYAMFAIFADVRNIYGDRFIPISAPRGVPEDASPEYKNQVEEWGVDGHSHSWLTLRELQDEFKSPDRFRQLVNDVLPAMAELGAPDDVRLVFFFDN